MQTKKEQLKEKFEKDFWSKKDDDITPLEFSSKWWIAERKTLLEEIREDISENKKKEISYEGIQLMERHEREEYNEEIIGFNKGLDTALKIIEGKE